MLRRLLAALLLAVASSSAFAFYGTAGAPAGWGGAAGQWFFGGPGTQGATWVGTHANVSATFAGRNIPARLTLAPNAAQVIARAALTTPYGRAATFIAWALAAGWVWSEAQQSWMVPQTQPAAAGNVYKYVWGQVEYHSWGALCAAAAAGTDVNLTGAWRLVSIANPYPDNYRCQVEKRGSGSTTYFQEINGTAAVTRSGWTCGGMVSVPQGTPCPTGQSAPATQTDADTLPQRAPMPDAVPNEAQQYVPLPQSLPEVEPSRIPTGSPVAQGTTPETYRQPVTDVRPAPTINEPWRVDAQPGTVVSSNPDGVTDVQHLDGSDPPAESASAPGLCDQYPDILACQELGEAPDDEVPTSTREVSYDPVSIGGASGCPASVSMGDHEISFAGLCGHLNTIRPLVIAIGFFVAALIVSNALRA